MEKTAIDLAAENLIVYIGTTTVAPSLSVGTLNNIAKSDDFGTTKAALDVLQSKKFITYFEAYPSQYKIEPMGLGKAEAQRVLKEREAESKRGPIGLGKK